MDYPYRLPGSNGPDIVIQTATFGPRVLVDGARVPGRGVFRRTYPIGLPDGTVHELTISDGPGGLRAVADGVTTQVGPGTMGAGSTWIDFVFALLPIVVIVSGGLVGGLIGGLGCGINFAISRTRASRPLKWLAMVGVTAVAVVVWLGVAFALRSAISPPVPSHPFALASGTCLNGYKPGVTITVDMLQPVDCAGAHDNEIVGGSVGPTGQAFPGETVLQSYAATVCLPAFRGYVGIDIDASRLDMLPLLPTDAMWSRGERELSCVVLARDGSKLTGSVRGTGR